MDVGEFLERALHRDDLARVRQKSALNPFIGLSIVVVPAFLLFARFGPAALAPYAFLMAVVPVLATLVVAIAFAIWDRDRLSTDEFQLRKQSLRILESKFGPIVDPEQLAVVVDMEPKRALQAEAKEHSV